MIDIQPAAQRTIGIVTSVGDDQLGLPTPCANSNVGDLIDHLGVFAVRFTAAARKETEGDTSPPPPPSGTNLQAGWRERISRDLLALADAWSDPQAWLGITHAGGLEMPAEVVGLVALDELVIHGWDLAVATAQPYAPEAQEIDAATSFVAAFDAPRDGRLFGPIVAADDDATPFDRLLALTGRDPAWRSPAGEPRFGAAAQAAEWDARYGEHDEAMWSGRPNGRLVAEVADLAPGRALDVGCGEGADAVWLARRGWTVTAIDISDVAMSRGREAADAAGVVVDWVCGDALQTSFPVGSFDLVSMQYPALPKAAGDAAVRALLEAIRPGGVLLTVYHDLGEEHREHMKSRGFDPADYVGADDLEKLLGEDFTVELRAVEPRIDPPPGNPHIADVVLRARRR